MHLQRLSEALPVDAYRVITVRVAPEVSEPLMAAIAREQEAARRARRGLSASAPFPKILRISDDRNGSAQSIDVVVCPDFLGFLGVG